MLQNKKTIQNILAVGESSNENMEGEVEETVSMVEYNQEENEEIEQEEGDIEHEEEEDECMEQIKVEYSKVILQIHL